MLDSPAVTNVGFGRRTFLRALGTAALFTGAPRVALGEVEYSAVDRATVRVISLGGVKTIRVRTKSGKTHRLAMPEVGHGSGILTGNDGLILTAYHVIEKVRFVAVRVPGSPKAYPAEVVYKNKKRDFAFIAIPEKAAHVLPLPPQAPRLQVRQTVFAIGYPLDAQLERPQSTQGIVSGVLPDGRLQLGISVNPGNSGGPIIDQDGRLVGLLVARGNPRLGVQGIGAAVPLDSITMVYDRILKQGQLTKATQRVLAAGQDLWAKAELTAVLAQDGSTLGMVREATAAVSGEKSGGIMRSLAAALKVAGNDADIRVLAGAYYWNAAHVLRELGSEDWQKSFSRAKSNLREAVKLDKNVVVRSPFVRIALRDWTN